MNAKVSFQYPLEGYAKERQGKKKASETALARLRIT
jgi:hypothetical protein